MLGLTACGDDEPLNNNQPVKKQKQTENPISKNDDDKMYKIPTFIYKNTEFNFSLELPENWKGQYVVEKSNWNTSAEATLDFKYKNGDFVLFSIMVFPLEKKEWEVNYDNGIWKYLGTNRDKKTFAFVSIQQMPSELNKKDPTKIEQFAYFSNMVNVDVPKISLTFQPF